MPLPKVTSYVKNVGRSIAYSGVDYLKGTNENIADFLETNEDVFKTVYASVTDMRRTARRAKIAIKKSKIYEAADAGWKAVKEDLKTGNFYNKKRDDELGMKAMGSDFADFSFDDDFNFDDIDNFGDESISVAESAEDARVQKQTNQLLDGFAAAVGKSAQAQAQVTASSIAYLADIQRASALQTYTQMQRIQEISAEGFKGIHTGITKMQDALNVHIENSRTFFESTSKVLQESNAMMKEFLEMQRNLYDEERRKPKYRESAMRNITTSGGLPDFAEWGKQIQKNLKNIGGGMGDMLLGNGMGEDANMLLAMVGSPLKFIPNAIIKGIVPNQVRKSMKRLDRTSGALFSNLIGRMANSRKSYDDGLFGLFSKIFGVDIDEKTYMDPSVYHKGPMPFDGITRRSIIEVIPAYLRRIESAVTGNGERIYDFKSGKWRNYTEVKKQFERQKEMDIASAMYDLQDTIRDLVRDLSDRGKARSAKELQDQVTEMFKEIYADNGVFTPYKKSGEFDPEMYQKYHFKSESEFYKVVDYLMKKNPAGMANMAKNVQSQKETRAAQIRAAEVDTDAFRELFTDAFSGPEAQRMARGGSNILTAMNDKYGHNIFDYLRTIVGQIEGIKQRGIGGGNGGGGYTGGRRPAVPHRPSPTLTTNEMISRLMNDKAPERNDEPYLRDENTTGDLMDAMDDLAREKEQEKRLKEREKNTTKKQLEKLGINGDAPLAEQMLRATKLSDKFTVAKANIEKLLNKPSEFLALQIEKVDQHLMKMMFGKPVKDNSGKDYDNFIDLIAGKVSDTFDKAAEEIDKKMDWIKEKIQPWIDKAKKKLHWDEFKASLKRQGQSLWGGFKGSMGRTYGRGYKYLRQRLEEGKVISPEDMQYYDEMNSYWGDTGPSDEPDDRVDWSQFMDEMDGPLSRDDYDDIVYGSARGRRIRKTGLTMVSPGEVIIPATFNKRKQNKQKNRELSVFRRMFKGGPTPRTNAAGNDRMLRMFANNPEMMAKWQSIYAAMGHSGYDVTANIRSDMGRYDSLASMNRLSHYMGDDAPVLEINGRIYRAQSDYKRDLAAEEKKYGKGQRGYSSKSIEQDYTPAQANKQLEQWVNFSANTDKGTVRKILKENKGFGVDAVAGGVLGGGIGLLLGGPLLGAAIGAGINLTKHSETMQKFLFGEEVDGERQGGLVGKKLIDGFDKYFGDMKDFGLAGGVAGLFTPFGPVGGIMIGSAIGYAKNNEKFQDWLFGKRDTETQERVGGFMSKDVQDLIHKAVPNMTKGAIAGVLLGPFSILPNMALGAGVGMLATSQEFQEMILGVKDKDTGKREGGLVGAFKDGFIKPAKEKLADLLDEAKDFTVKHVLNPLKDFAKPMTNALINMASDIAHGVKDAAVDMLEKSLGGPLKHFMQTRFFKGAVNLLGKATRIPINLGKLAIGAPAHALGFIGNSMRMSQIRRGTDRGSTAAEREAFMNKHFIRSGKLPFYSHEARVNDKRMGSMTQEELDDFIARGSNLLSGDRGLAKQRVGIADEVGKKILDYFDQNGLTETYGKYAKKIAKAVKTGDELEVTTAIRAAMIPPQHQRPLLALLQDGIQQNAKLNDIRAQGRGTLKDLSKQSGFKLKNRRELRHMLEYAKSEKKDIRFAPDEVEEKMKSNDPQVRIEGGIDALSKIVTEGLGKISAQLRVSADPTLELDPENPSKVRKKSPAGAKSEPISQWDDLGGGIAKFDPQTGNALDDKQTNKTLKERERRLEIEEEQAEATKENAKGLKGLWQGLFGKKEEKNKGSGMLMKLLGLVGGGIGSFFGWSGSVLAKFGIPVIGAGLGISALGWGSQWWKTTAWPSLKNFFLGKADPETGERDGGFLNGLYNSLGVPIQNGIQTVAHKIGELVGWFHDGGLQKLFTEKIIPNIITGWGYFAENILGPLVGTIIGTLPKLGIGIIKGLGKGLRSLLPGGNKSIGGGDKKGEAEMNELVKDAQNLMKSSGSITDNVAPEYKESLNAIGKVQSSFAKGYSAGKTYASQDLDMGLEDVSGSPNERQTLLGSKRTNTVIYDENGNDITDYKMWNTTDSLGGKIIKGSGRNFINALSGATSGTSMIARGLSHLKIHPSRFLLGPLGMVTQSVKGVGKLTGLALEGSGRAGSALRNSILAGTQNAAKAGSRTLANGADMVDNLMGGAGKSAALSNLDDAIGKSISENADDALSKAGSIIANTADDVAEAGANAATTGGGIFSKIGKALNAAKNKGQELLSKITGSSATKAATKTAANAAKSSGGLLNAIKNGISKAFSWLAESKVGKVITGAAKKATSNKFVQAILAPGGIAKVLNKLASVISNLGEGAIAKGTSGVLSKIAGACGRMSPLTFIFMVTDFLDGWRNAETSLGVSKNDYTAPWYLKMAAGLAQIINGRFFLGLVHKDWIMNRILDVFKTFGLDISDVEAARDHAEDALKELNAELIANGEDPVDNMQDANKKIAEQNSIWGKFKKAGTDILNKFKNTGTSTTRSTTSRSSRSTRFGGRGRAYMKQAQYQNKRFGTSTLGQAGCGPIAAANMMDYLSGGDRVGAAAAMAQHYIDPATGGTTINYFNDYFRANGVPSTQTDSRAALMANLQRGGKAVILGHGKSTATTDPFGNGDHYINVLGTRNRGQDMIIDDPDMPTGRRRLPTKRVLSGMKSSVLVGRGRGDRFERLEPLSGRGFSDGARGAGFSKLDASTGPAYLDQLDGLTANLDPAGLTAKSTAQLNNALGVKYDFATGAMSPGNMPTSTLNTSNLGPDAIINIAISQIGYGPSYKHSKYDQACVGRDRSAHWCGSFVWWCFNQAGAEHLIPCQRSLCPSCDYMYKGFAQAGQEVKTPQKGDILFFSWDGGTNCDHVGIVTGVAENGYVLTIEGNTSDPNKNATYGCVQRKKRNPKNIIHYVRPKYPYTYDASKVVNMTNYGDKNDYKRIALMGGQMDPNLLTYSQSSTFNGMNGTPGDNTESTGGKLISALKNLGVSVLKAMYGRDAYEALFGEAQTDDTAVYGDDSSYNAHALATGTYSSDIAGNTTAQKIWNRLGELGYTKEGRAGIMGNLRAESGLIPNNLQNTANKRLGVTDEQYTSQVDQGTRSLDSFMHDSGGYGLAQWTYKTRKQGLYNATRQNGRSIADLAGQLGFLDQELSGYPKGLQEFLKSTNDINKASDRFLDEFERPAKHHYSQRRGFSQDIYASLKDYAPNTNGATASQVLRDPQTGAITSTGGMTGSELRDAGMIDDFGSPVNESNTMNAVDEAMSDPTSPTGNKSSNRKVHRTRTGYSASGRGRNGLNLRGSQIRRSTSFSGMARMPGTAYTPYQGAASANQDIYDMIASIVQILMQVANNTALLDQVVKLLSNHLGVDVKASDVQQAVQTGNLDQAQRNLDRLISRSSGNNSNVSSLLQSKDSAYLVDAMTALARE